MVTTEDGRAIPVQLTTAEGHPISTGFPGADVSLPTTHLQVGPDLGGKSLACVGDGLIVVKNKLLTFSHFFIFFYVVSLMDW